MTKKTTLQRPSKVSILGRDYTIEYVPQSPLRNTYLGLCDNHSQAILIEDAQTPIEEVDTVLHEILHGVRFMTSMETDSETEERFVRTFATGLVSVLQENPEFARWLIAPRGA